MENKAHAMAAGIFVVALALLLLGLAAWLTRDTAARERYEISTRENVTGLQQQAPVRYRGVDVGKVASIGFDPQKQGNVLIRLDVDSGVPITSDTFAQLSYQGVTGLAFVQLGDHGKQATPLVPNDDHPPRIPLEAGLLAKLQDRGEIILDQVEQVTTRLNRLLSDENQSRAAATLASLEQAAGSANQLMQRLDTTVAKRVDPALEQATATMQALRKTSDSITQTSDEFRSTARRLNAKDGPIDRLAEGSHALAQSAESFNLATLPRLNRVTEDASRAARQLSRTVNAINDNPQSLIFGSGAARPGPGEPGFVAPATGGQP